MSTTPSPATPHNKGGPRLTEGQRRLIVAAVLAGERQSVVAKRFGVHHNTVYTLCKSVKGCGIPGEPSDWRQKLTSELPAKSVKAIELSLNDTVDVHKAASTALAHLKGIGALNSDSGANVSIFVANVGTLPPDWQTDYFQVEEGTPTGSGLPLESLDQDAQPR